MLYLNLQSVFKTRGIENAYSLLVKAGISPHSASDLLTGQSRSIRLEHLEKICILLKCTPNDLFVWKAGADIKSPETLPLHALKHEPDEKNIYEALQALPLEELKKLTRLISSAEKP